MGGRAQVRELPDREVPAEQAEPAIRSGHQPPGVDVLDRLAEPLRDAALDVSPPAVSAAIKGFERRYGYRLFVRNPARGLAVTPSGRSFVTQARRLLEAERGFDNRAQGIGQQFIGELHVGCYFITAPFLLGQVVRRLASKHPSLKLTLHEGDLIRVVRDLKAGYTDVAVTYDIYLDGGVEFEPLFETSPHVIISERDPLAAKPVLSLRDLVDKPMVLLDLPATQDYFMGYFHAYGLHPDVGHACSCI